MQGVRVASAREPQWGGRGHDRGQAAPSFPPAPVLLAVPAQLEHLCQSSTLFMALLPQVKLHKV